jgi:GNAT superfamily N-acetyltransferase
MAATHRFTIDTLPIPATLDGPAGEDFRAMTDVRNRVEAHALGSETLAVTAEELLPGYQRQEYEPRDLYVARVEGRIVGRAIFSWSIAENSRVSWLFAYVLPEFRNLGIGTALFETMEARSIAEGRPVLQSDTIHSSVEGGERLAPPTGFGDVSLDDPGARFLHRRGYRLEQIGRISFLDLPVDPELLASHRAAAEAKAGPDYSVISWVGLTPPEWRTDLAYLKNRMSVDEPAAGLEVDEEPWDEARVVSHDEAEIAGGRDMLVSVVLHEPSGRLVGINELSIGSDRTRPVGQEDTLVLAEHRGHRLGMLLKVANLQELARLTIDPPLVFTFNAEENRHMLNVNEAVGFRAVGYDGAWKKTVTTADEA